jgi:Protein of unknown function (DUF1524)/Excalibur calcium-binding domain
MQILRRLGLASVTVLALAAFTVPMHPGIAATTVVDYGVNAAVGPLATTALASLPVKGWAPMTGYSRAMFGIAWADTDHNGCDQRDDALWRASLQRGVRTDGCTVISATVTDVYTNHVVHFVRGGQYSQGLDIDHVVALGNAWATGVQYESPMIRLKIATDPLNLLAVDPSQNRQKSDSNAASWLPPAVSYRCAYVARQIAVKKKYGLWVVPPEKVAMQRVLSTCPLRRLPVGGLAYPTAAELRPVKSNVSTTTTVYSSTSLAGGALDPRFATCAAAKAKGYGPYVQGKDPEYAWYRDGNHNGVDCE